MELTLQLADCLDLGWQPDTVGEIDHRLLKTPSVKLRGVHASTSGERVYTIDLRFRRPNANESMTSAQAHSMEHFLLEGFRRLLPQSFVALGVMGCQTGFYLTLMGEGHRKPIEGALAAILRDMRSATQVPYANVEQCGHWRNHDLAAAQAVARQVLAKRARWRDVV